MHEHELRVTIPAAKPVDETVDEKVERMERWLAGHVDKEGKHHPGLVQMVGEMWEDNNSKKERWEAVRRGLTIGGFVSSVGIIGAWLKDHIK